MGSSKTPSSAHNESFFNEGRPANSWYMSIVFNKHYDMYFPYIKDAAYEGLLVVIERDTRGCFDVGALNIDIFSTWTKGD